MRILGYDIGLNESFYFRYQINGLRRLGHEVIELPRDNNGRIISEKIMDLNWYKEISPDLIMYLGFSAMNAMSHQLLSFFPPIELDIPYFINFYDSPLRYLNVLQHLKGSKYTLFCCDSKLVEKMKGFGFDRTFFSPCMYDPKINKPYPKNPEMEHDIV
jgi:hypothetical protein